MQDINYYMRSFEHKLKIMKGEKINGDPGEIFESFVSKKPVVYQIETTNVCNMKCAMCPRRLMKRKIGHMPMKLYKKLIDQIEPHSAIDLLKWRQFIDLVLSKAGIIQSEQDFFNFVISAEALTMHGFGEPLLDPHIVERVKLVSDKGIPAYFSCNPINMTDRLFQDLLDANIGYIKYSVDGLDEKTLKKFRGRKMNIQKINDRIEKSVETIEKGGYKTIIVLTMLGFETNKEQTKEFLKKWQNRKVYAYIKSAINRRLVDEALKDNEPAYIRSFCEYPFVSLTVLQDGTVVPCCVDYDGEIPLGNANQNTLEEIWQGDSFKKFRMDFARGYLAKNHFCNAKCDLPVLGNVLNVAK